MPGGPTSVTIRGSPADRPVGQGVGQHLGLSLAPDQSPVVGDRSVPVRPRGVTTDHTGRGCALPFACSGGSEWKSI